MTIHILGLSALTAFLSAAIGAAALDLARVAAAAERDCIAEAW